MNSAWIQDLWFLILAKRWNFNSPGLNFDLRFSSSFSQLIIIRINFCLTLIVLKNYFQSFFHLDLFGFFINSFKDKNVWWIDSLKIIFPMRYFQMRVSYLQLLVTELLKEFPYEFKKKSIQKTKLLKEKYNKSICILPFS